MTFTREIRPDMDEGIDRKELGQLRARFMQLNQGRLARTREGLSTRQQTVLNLIPLLFHANHPLLPGYVSGHTPAGISNYEPDALALAEVQRLSRSFSHKPRHDNPSRPIHGLFLMGSLGTLAQAEQSDLDVWVCHVPDLAPDALQALRKKCQALETWAASQGTETHFFLIDPQRFARGERDGQLGPDDCGTTQHYLLLDEFYRTAIWLAGRTPLWWLVPAYEESRYEAYSQALLSKRFVASEEVLDLGHLARIPAGEFIGAGLWQLFKGIESPYKSVLKLLLIEVYASEFPQVQCLSLRFKQSVYADHLDLDELDPYVMVYRRIEEYLTARAEPERLELVRRSLYLKVNKKLGSVPRLGERGWQRQLLERLAGEWGWDERQLALLDSRSQWKVRQVGSERRTVVNELNYSYRFLLRFDSAQNAANQIDRRDLNILGRRLYAAFERKAGKVECINPGIAPNLAEDTVTLLQAPILKEPGQTHWNLYSGNLTAQECAHFAPLKRSRGLIELLAWSHCNGVIDSSTRVALHPGTSDLVEYELLDLLGSLQKTVRLPMAAASDDDLLRPSTPRAALLLMNVGLNPLKRDPALAITRDRTDSLSFGSARKNLALTQDLLTLNSWNEVQAQRYDGPHALLDCLRDYLSALPAEAPQPSLRVRCYGSHRAQPIALRVERVLSTAQALLAEKAHYRYLLQIGQHYHALELETGNVRHVPLSDLQTVLDYLGQERSDYSPVYLDSHALQDHDLAMLLPQGRTGCIQVFYRAQQDAAQLYVLDEFNTLWQQNLPFHDEHSLLAPLQRFFQSIVFRRVAKMTLNSLPIGDGPPTLYYQLLATGSARAHRVEPRPSPNIQADKPFYAVQAIIERAAAGQPHVTLFCNQKEFSEFDHGDQLYRKVAEEIIGQRREAERYRCYITDLDLSGPLGDGPGSTGLYLRYKAELERALNQVLALI
ncbi:class I adenylate cyclase [Pseudomonas sp. R5(2019)]|uniref:class I adenylate cyclase n=1 Tax=Pseudomonas sp. R5(2019) TaxID=2697566 RepID=UPI0014127915|nr:class I adenylate cyclase [Pseudomonas sp. R5(2019)]NBA94360.1 adenylate cyclase [Pseudomonas sp. R5(2019)]